MKKILTTILLCGFFGFSAAVMAGNPPDPSITLKAIKVPILRVVRVQLIDTDIPEAKTQTYWLNHNNKFTKKVPLAFTGEHIKIENVWLWGAHKAGTLEPGTESLAKEDTLRMKIFQTKPDPKHQSDLNLDCMKVPG